MTAHDDLDLVMLTRVTEELVAAVSSANEDQRNWETPCPDWDLSALLDHVAGGNWFTKAMLGGATSEAAIAAATDKFDRGSASMNQVITSAGEQLQAFSGLGVLDKTWHHVAGDLPGRQVLRIRLHDLIVHTWDIQQTIDPPAVIADDVLSWAFEELATSGSRAAELFGTQVETLAAETDSATYLARFGRNV